MARLKSKETKEYEVVKVFPFPTLSLTLDMSDPDYKYTEESRIHNGEYTLLGREKFWWEK